MKTYRLLCSLVVLAAASATAEAQVIYNSAATAGESWARGMGDVIRSQGAYNVMNSEAALNYTQARSQELDNQLQSAETYFAMRNLNTQQRFGDYSERRAVNSQNRMFRYGQEGRPRRPTNRELDPLTGTIHWPFTLQTADFEQERQTLDKMFQERAQQQGAVGLEGYEAMMAATDAMLAQLKKNIRKMNPQDYTTAKNFVERLAYDIRFPTS